MKTKKPILIGFLLIFIISIIASIPFTYATNYQWLSNTGFEDALGTNIVTNGDFGSGALDNGWNGTATIINTYSYSPTFSCLGSTTYAWFTLTTSIPVGNIKTGSAWVGVYNTAGQRTWTLVVYYTDGSSSTGEIKYTGASYSWQQVNIFANITFLAGKSIASLKFTASGQSMLDDLVINLGTTGQTNISTTTLPFYKNGYSQAVSQLGAINKTFGHSGSCSYQDSFGYSVTTVLGGTSTTSSQPEIIWQNLPNQVYTNNVTQISLWAYTQDSASYQIKFYYLYTDGYLGTKTITFNSFNQWSFLDFTGGLLTNKILSKIGFQLVGGTIAVNQQDHNGAFYVYVDDISVYANVPTTQTTLTWTITPTPILWNIYSFQQYVGISSTIIYYVYDVNGLLTENGTAIISTGLGTQNVTVTLGVFSFSLSARPSKNSTEFITSQIILPSRIIVTTIEATWIKSEKPNPTNTANIDFGNTTPTLNTQFIGGIILIVTFALLFGYYAGKDGLLVGLVLAIFINSVIGLFPIYGLILSIIIGAILIVSHTGIPKADSGGS